MDGKIKEAIILAGGLGTRLRPEIGDYPKPMAPVNNKPFLHYLLHYLANQGIQRFILSVGFRWEIIYDHFGDEFEGVTIKYAVEKEPMGTGGGIKMALNHVKGEHAFILNGDTFFKISLKDLAEIHFNNLAECTVALKKMFKVDRYGSVQIEGERITAFKEKDYRDETVINGGIYCVRKNLLDGFPENNVFSFEKDYLEKNTSEKMIFGKVFEQYFMDIGIPEDYRQFSEDMDEDQI